MFQHACNTSQSVNTLRPLFWKLQCSATSRTDCFANKSDDNCKRTLKEMNLNSISNWMSGLNKLPTRLRRCRLLLTTLTRQSKYTHPTENQAHDRGRKKEAYNLCLQVSMASATGSWCVTFAPLTYCMIRPTMSKGSGDEEKNPTGMSSNGKDSLDSQLGQGLQEEEPAHCQR